MSEPRIGREVVYQRGGVSISRLTGGVPRAGDGRHCRLLAYVHPTMSTPELIRELREVAEQLAKTLPRVAE